jgi:hypothetical protein
MKLSQLFIGLVVGSACFSSFVYANDDYFYRAYQDFAISSAAGTPWNATKQVQLVQKAKDFGSQMITRFPQKSYPINEVDLEAVFQENQSSTIPFFAYSSMIDIQSGAAKAISPEAASTQTPAVAFGIQRTFNREMPAATVEGGWGKLKRSNDLAILNVFEKEDAVLNGVVFQLPLSDLMILSKREVGYDLIPVVVTKWSDACDDQKEPEMFIAYTFRAPNPSTEGSSYTSAHINPIPGYFNYLQIGLQLQGDDFKAMWWATTYLADQKTLVTSLPYQDVDLNAVEEK